ncbi:MAG: ABC transporter permease [Dehalococcoidales bacterium]|nr:ABC transporter permease [Dehalococcoidales bacterium]
MMSVFHIARRVILQVLRDRRTIALLIIVPLIIASIVGVSIPDRGVLDYIAPALLAVLILFFGFLISGISVLRERSQGTMERLLAAPLSRMDIVAGYLLGFLAFALLQTLIIFFYMVYVLDLNYRGDLWQILIFEVLIGIMAVCLGTFCSVFARNEFQIMQFIPMVIVPQIFLCGVLWPVEQMPEYLQWIGKVLPLYYGAEGIRRMMLLGESLLDIGREIGILAAYAIGLLVLAAATLRRGTAV